MCVTSAEDISINRRIFHVVSGPLASLLIAGVACYGIFAWDAHDHAKLFFVVFVGLAIRDLLVNLIPSSRPIVLHDGTSTYNDGYTLKQLFFFKRQLPALEKGQQLLAEGQYAPAARIFETVLKEERGSAYAYRIVRDLYLNVHNYGQALKLQEKLQEKHPVFAQDYLWAGLMKSQLERHSEALLDYQKALDLNPLSKYPLLNMGFTYTILAQFEEAVRCFDQALAMDTACSYSYSGRGLARAHLGDVTGGWTDIRQAEDLGSAEDSYVYLHIGRFHLLTGDLTQARYYLEKARDTNPRVYNIENLLQQTHLPA